MNTKFEIHFSGYVNVSGHLFDGPFVRATVRALLKSSDLLGGTLTNATGFWQGTTEPSWTLTIIDDSRMDDDVYRLAERIRDAFEQHEVLVTSSLVESKTI